MVYTKGLKNNLGFLTLFYYYYFLFAHYIKCTIELILYIYNGWRS